MALPLPSPAVGTVIRAGAFRQNLPSPLPACPPASLSSLPCATPGTFKDHSEYSDLPTSSPAGGGRGYVCG